MVSFTIRTTGRSVAVNLAGGLKMGYSQSGPQEGLVAVNLVRGLKMVSFTIRLTGGTPCCQSGRRFKNGVIHNPRV